jgi:hypothetical protein
VSLYESLLFVHVVAGFLMVAGLVSYAVIVLGGAGDAPRRALGAPATASWNVGGIGVLVFGVWLAIEVDAYELWDAWIIAAVGLWLIASGAGGPLSRAVRERPDAFPDDRARVLLAVMAIATAALLADMIFKPGA